jgi:Uma2 family endonuclease
MTTLAPPRQITPRQRLWTVNEYHQMAYPVLFGPDERLELIEGEIFFRGTETHRPFTLEEYRCLQKLGFVQEGDQIELVEGEGVPTMSPMGPPHAVSVAKTSDALRAVFSEGYTIRGQIPSTLSVRSEPEPDVLVAPGVPDDYWDHHPSPAEALLVVEVSDSSLRPDRGRKAVMYARAGVTDYWIVNIADRALEVRRRPENGEYLSVSVYDEDEAIAPLAAPTSPVLVSQLLPLKRPTHP